MHNMSKQCGHFSRCPASLRAKSLGPKWEDWFQFSRAEAVGASLEITLAQARQHLIREDRATYKFIEVVKDEHAQDEAERQKLAQSEQLKSILDDAEARIQATGGVKHEDFWKQLDGEYQDVVTKP
jgi:hypothetical protein